MSYLPNPCTSSRKIKIFSNYATKSDLNTSIFVDISKFAKKADLASLKSDIGKLHINKIKKVPSGLNSLKSKVHKLEVATWSC